MPLSPNKGFWGDPATIERELHAAAALVMDAKEFERFHECMTNPAKPSKTMIEAAKLHQLMTLAERTLRALRNASCETDPRRSEMRALINEWVEAMKALH